MALQRWSAQMMRLRTAPKSRMEKLQGIIQLTRDTPILFPVIKKIALELKRSGWDEKSWQSRLGAGAAVWAMLVIAKAGAGLALLGTAVAVPLWIVFGSGDTFVKTLKDELRRKYFTD